uniref:Glucosamine 6-phosphate N-acetyltransferase n=1 Tax=Rhabditophanes sp. KR3021 TaxID=114890 RepID=A0AC35TH95_9BILA
MVTDRSHIQMPESSDTTLFDSNILLKHVTKELPDGFLMRPLQFNDYEKGYLSLLGELTSVGKISRGKWNERFNSMREANGGEQSYYVVVIEDLAKNQVVASATLVIEFKFIHGAGSRGRVEDVVCDTAYRGRRFAQGLNTTLVSLAKSLGVYKISLECKDSLISYYELFGFVKDCGNNFLVQRFD